MGLPIYEAMPAWHGLNTRGTRQRYDPKTHMNAQINPILKYIDAEYAEKIRAVFPLLFRTFFKVVPERKNFMSYGFVIMKLLHMMGLSTSGIPIKMVKTKSKLKQAELYWTRMLSQVTLNL